MEQKTFSVIVSKDGLNATFPRDLLDSKWEIRDQQNTFVVQDPRNFIEENLRPGNGLQMVCPHCLEPVQSGIKTGETLHQYTERLKGSQQAFSASVKAALRGRKKGKEIVIFHNDCRKEKRIETLSFILHEITCSIREKDSFEFLLDCVLHVEGAQKYLLRKNQRNFRKLQGLVFSDLERLAGKEWPRHIISGKARYDYLLQSWIKKFKGQEIELSLPKPN